MLLKLQAKCLHVLWTSLDSIWHQGLFYKHSERGLGSKTYNLIKSMYTKLMNATSFPKAWSETNGRYSTSTPINLHSVWNDLQSLVSLKSNICSISTNNACRGESGKHSQIIKIHKWAVKFWKHLKLSIKKPAPSHIILLLLTSLLVLCCYLCVYVYVFTFNFLAVKLLTYQVK